MLNPEGEATTDFDVQQHIFLEVRYWNLLEGNSPKVSIIVRGQLEEPVFASVNLPSENTVIDPWFDSPFPYGLYETTCRFPANLFNTLTYSIDLMLVSHITGKPLDVLEKDLLSFSVHDMYGKDTSGIAWQGGTHPKLTWQTRRLESAKEV